MSPHPIHTGSWSRRPSTTHPELPGWQNWGVHAAEWRSLAAESNSEIFYEGLLQLGQRLETENRLEAAAQVYAMLVTYPSPSRERVPEGRVRASFQEIRRRAQERLDTIAGTGSSAHRAEFLLRRLARETMEPSTLVGLTAASAAFRMTRLASLSRLLGSPTANFATRGFGARAAAGLLGFGMEATIFPLASRGASAVLGRDLDWSFKQVGREIAGSFIVLGAMKLTGSVAGRVLTRPANAVIGGPRPALQQAGMFAGILLGHHLETAVGLRPHVDGATTFVDSLAILVQFNAAGRLAHGVMGEGFRTWEMGLDHQARTLLASSSLFPGRGRPVQPKAGQWIVRPARSMIPATAGGHMGPPLHVEVGLRPRDLFSPNNFMTGDPSGGSSWRNDLLHASALRHEIRKPEAWQGRAQRVQDYFQYLENMPPAQSLVLDEILYGMQMVGDWAQDSNSFIQAIAFRQYENAWRLLSAKYGDFNDPHAIFLDRFEAEFMRHGRLLAMENHGPYLRSLLRASPSVAFLGSQLGPSFPQGSPRARFLDSRITFLQILSERTQQSQNAAIRPEMLAALDGVMDKAPAGDLRVGRENIFILRRLRDWIHTGDAEQRDLGLKYLPYFWDHLASKFPAGPTPEILQRDLVEEIAYLQQTTFRANTSKSVLISSLRAYPHYAQYFLARMAPHPVQVMIGLRTLLLKARDWRPWILAHPDAEVRTESAHSYRVLMGELNRVAATVQDFTGRLPETAHEEIFQEMVEALDTFHQRLKTNDSESLSQAVEDFALLVEQLPSSQLATEAVKMAQGTLSKIFLNSDPRVREAAENGILRLFERIPADPSDDN